MSDFRTLEGENKIFSVASPYSSDARQLAPINNVTIATAQGSTDEERREYCKFRNGTEIPCQDNEHACNACAEWFRARKPAVTFSESLTFSDRGQHREISINGQPPAGVFPGVGPDEVIAVLHPGKLLNAHQELEALILRAGRVMEERHLIYLSKPCWDTAETLANAHEWLEQLPHLRDYPLLHELTDNLAKAMDKVEAGDLVSLVWRAADDSTDEAKPEIETAEPSSVETIGHTGTECLGCKMPYDKVGKYGDTDYCFACWIVVSGQPITNFMGGGQ